SKRVAAGRVLPVAVGSESAPEIEIRLAARDEVQGPRRRDGAEHLRDDVRDEIGSLEAPADEETDRDGRIQVAPGDVSDRVRHREHGEAEGERDPDETDAHVRKRRGEDSAPASSEDQPERSDELRCDTLR